MSNLKISDGTNIRAKWNDDEDQWWFVVQDVIAFLTESDKPRDYWYRMKKRVLESDGVELSTICRQLKFPATNGKTYKYECSNNEGLFRIIQNRSLRNNLKLRPSVLRATVFGVVVADRTRFSVTVSSANLRFRNAEFCSQGFEYSKRTFVR